MQVGWNKKITIAITLVLSGLSPARASDFTLTAGTTHQAAGQGYAYLFLQATGAGLPAGATYHVFSRPGLPGSGAAFAFRGVMQPVAHADEVEALLPLAETLGQDLVALHDTIDNLFYEIVPAAAITLSTKLAALVLAAQTDDALRGELGFLAYRHPAVAMALGIGFACTLPDGNNTLEVRAVDPVSGGAGEVVAELTLDPTSPFLLPAPDDLSEVPETSPRGNLQIRLRWSQPEALRRVAMLNFGFNVYRIDAAYAEQAGYHTNPPPATMLRHLLSVTNAVYQANDAPVLISEEQEADPGAFLFIDANDYQEPGRRRFRDGEAFYYYVTATDILGRDGEVSAPLYVVACTRMPPGAPRNIEVSEISVPDTNGLTRMVLQVKWEQVTAVRDPMPAGYLVQRWRDFDALEANIDNAASNVAAGFIPHDPDAEKLSFLDAALTTNDIGQVYWYTVRTISSNACGTMFSHPSAPQSGLLANYQPPLAPTGAVYIICGQPYTTAQQPQVTANQPRSEIQLSATLDARQAAAQMPDIAYVEFWIDLEGDPASRVPLGREAFAAGEDRVMRTVHDVVGKSAITAFAQCGTTDGRTSGVAQATLNISGGLEGGELVEFKFDVGMIYTQVLADADCDEIPRDDLIPPGLDPGSNVVFRTDPNALTWQVYRTVDGGPFSLIDQGNYEADAVAAAWEDISRGLPNAGTICYYLRHVSSDGIPSEYRLLICIDVPGRYALPTPVLDRIESADPNQNVLPDQLVLSWFCPPTGVQAFDIWLGLDPQRDPPPATISGDLTPNLEGTNTYMRVPLEDDTGTVSTFRYRMARYRTASIGTDTMPADTSTFSVTVSNINATFPHVVLVRAVAAHNIVGENSNAETYRYRPRPDLTDPDVPWPARVLPGSGLVEEQLQARFLDADQLTPELPRDYPAVRIGTYVAPTNQVTYNDKLGTEISGEINPQESLFTDASGMPITPFMLYRYQLTNALYPEVSGDIVQVSPLIEDIPYGVITDDGPVRTVFYDPLTVLLNDPAESSEVLRRYHLYYLDVQPVLRGASYGYAVMLFDPVSKEIRATLPTTAVTIPESTP